MRPESPIEDPNHNVRRIFGCGTDYSTLKAVWNAQSSRTQRRLERVAWRVWISFKLRYHVRVISNRSLGTDEHYRTQAELNALEVYLLFTCLDALAGAGYQPFDRWLREADPTGPFSMEDIVGLYTDYQNEQGVTNRLRNLFGSLPRAIKEWLAENVAVTRGASLLGTDFEGHDEDLLAAEILKFFYKNRRNPFTHRGLAGQVAVSTDTEWPGNGDDMWSSSAGRERRRPGDETMHLHLRGSLDEATLLRVIIHSAVYNELGIDVDRAVISDVLKREGRLCALHYSLVEIESNDRVLEEWRLARSGDRSLLRYYGYRGPTRPSSDWIIKTCQRLRQDIPLEKGIRASLLEYAQHVNNLDQAVQAFNQENPLLDEHTGSEEYAARQTAIQELMADLIEREAFGQVQDQPDTNTLSHCWLVIRSPCYV